MLRSFGIPRGPQELAILFALGVAIYFALYFIFRRFAGRFIDPELPRVWLYLGGAFVGVCLFFYAGWQAVFYLIEPGWGRAIGLFVMPFTIIGGAVAGYLLTRHWVHPDGGSPNSIPTGVILRRTGYIMLAIFSLFVAIQIYFNWTAMSPSSRDAARRAPAIASLLAEVSAKREWRDIDFGCAIVDKHLGKSDRVGQYAKQFEAYGFSAKPYLQNHKYWMYFAFDRPMLRAVPFSRFWFSDRFIVAFQIKDDSPDAAIERCVAILWAAFPYI